MKTTLTALAFLALAATTAVAASGTAWLGQWIISDENPSTMVDAEAINSHLVKQFEVAGRPGGVILRVQESLSQDVGRRDPDCGYTIGVKLIGRRTFCGLYIIAFVKDRFNNVQMAMRFLGFNENGPEYRLVIPLYEKLDENYYQEESQAQEENEMRQLFLDEEEYEEEEENEIQELILDEEEDEDEEEYEGMEGYQMRHFTVDEGNQFNFIEEDWYRRIGVDDPVGTIVPFHFEWFDFLLDHKVEFVITTGSFPMEGDEHLAISYLSQPVVLPAAVMEKLRSALDIM